MATKLKTQACHTCGGSGSLPADGVGMVLREEREKAGIQAKEIADHMGISQSYMVDLERGTRRLTNELLASYQAALKELANGRG